MIDSNGQVLDDAEILRRVRTSDKDFINGARAMYETKGGTVVIDDDADINNPSSPGENFGRFVSAWVWVPVINDHPGE